MRTSHKRTHTRPLVGFGSNWVRLTVTILILAGLAFAVVVRTGLRTASANGIEAARAQLQTAKSQYLASPTKENTANYDKALVAYKAALKANPAGALAAAQTSSTPYVSEAVNFGVTPRASELTPVPPSPTAAMKIIQNKNKENELPFRNFVGSDGKDAALQTSSPPSPAPVTAPIQNFDGPDMDTGAVLFGGRFAPPDTNGDVGPNHVIVATNGGVTIYNKTGGVLVPQFRMSQLMPFPAAAGDDGDPVVLYDPLADRWILSQFGLTITNGSTHEIFAVSQTGDPTGAYFAYDFLLAPGRAGDYPHLGVWPDGIYMSTNDFNLAFNAFLGAGLYAFERDKMYAGSATAKVIGFSTNNLHGGMLPTDIDGLVTPPAGTPNLFIEFDATEFGAATDLIRAFAFHVDFDIPGNSTVTQGADVTTLAFDASQPSSRAVVEQPPPAAAADNLDSIADRLMHRLAYRNLGAGGESYVLNFTVNVSGVAGTTAATYQAGVRWMELRRTNLSPFFTISQQASYAPGSGNGATGRNLWMASIAQDIDGNIGLAASASSTTLIPTAIYTGRLTADPAGTLPQGEVDALAAVTRGVQTGTGNRWGDYSSLSVDPVDECTFWGAFEYVDAPTASFDWNTRAFSFKVNPAGCAAPQRGSLTGTATNAVGGALLSGVRVITSGGHLRTTNNVGTYSFTTAAPNSFGGIAPGTYTVTCRKEGFNTVSGTVTVTNGGSATFNCALTPIPIIGNPVATVSGGNGDGQIQANECNTVSVAVTNTGAATATNVTGTLTTSTPGVVIFAPATQPYPNIAPGASASADFKVSTTAGFVCGTTINFTLTVNYTGGAGSNVLNFSIATPPPVPNNFTFTTSSGNTLVPGTALVAGTSADDAVQSITLPFAYEIYGQIFTTAIVSTNGNLQFNATGSADFSNTCPLPGTATDALGMAIMPFWDDLDLATGGVFTSTSGTAPNRILNIEWRGVRFGTTDTVNFELRLFEGQRRFDFIYANVSATAGNSASVGVQRANAPTTFVTQFSCNTASLANGLGISFTAAAAAPCSGNGACITPITPTASLADPLACTGPGNFVNGLTTVVNPTAVALTGGTVNIALQANLLAIPGSCSATVGGANVGACAVVSPSLIQWTGDLAANSTLIITYQAQVGDVQPATQLCATITGGFANAALNSVTACVTVNCPAAGPGLVIPTTLPGGGVAPLSDQKPGSVLIYPVYTSTADSIRQNTRISITNTHTVLSAQVHLFFIEGATCSVADAFICLTPNQTATFLASDLDPGTTGYLVAMAVNPAGCPTSFNYLIGDEYVKFASGHAGNLGAESVPAVAGGSTVCTGSTAVVRFDGVAYAPLPRVVALDNIPSRADGNDTLLVLDRIGGDLLTTANVLTNLFGILYNDSEIGISFSFGSGGSPGVCQFRSSLSNNFPRTTPRFEQFIPTGRSGWLKIFSTADQAILGASFNFNPNATASAGAFNGGHNLHKLTLTTAATYTVPVLPVSCQ